jgi:hypothetical protein
MRVVVRLNPLSYGVDGLRGDHIPGLEQLEEPQGICHWVLLAVRGNT